MSSGTPSAPTDGRPLRDWTPGLVAIVVALAACHTMAVNVADPDLWGHVVYGRDVLDRGAIPATATYTYTAEGYRWINHENLPEIAMAWLVEQWGPIGLIAGKFLLGVLVLGTVAYLLRRENVEWLVVGGLTLLVASNLSYHWSFRPQVATIVGFTALIALLQTSFRGWRGRWHGTLPRRWFRREGRPGDDQLGCDSQRIRRLWWAVPLFAVWANSHGGVAAGLALYGAYLSVRAAEAIFERGWGGWGLVRRMALMMAAAVAAACLNPYGPRLLVWLAYSIGHARPEISDWNNQPLFELVGFKLWALIGVTLAGWVVSRRSRDAAELVVLGLTLWQALLHFRHAAFFIVAAGVWSGPHLQSVVDRLRSRYGRAAVSSRPAWIVQLSLAAVAFGLAGGLAHRLSEIRVPTDEYPVHAVQFMHEHELHGRLVVSFDWAQYALAALAADRSLPESERTRVAFDGRFRTCYPQVIVDAHFDFLFGSDAGVPRNRFASSAGCDPQWILEYGSPDLVLNRRRGERSERHVRQAGDQWTLLYQDGIAQVWGRRSRYGDPASPDYFSPSRRSIGDEVAEGHVRWPALPSAAALGAAPMLTQTSAR